MNVLAEERQMACGLDEFSLTLAELAFMESSEHVQTVLTITVIIVTVVNIYYLS